MERYQVVGHLRLAPEGTVTDYADAQAQIEALQRERDEAIRGHGKESGFWGRTCARLMDKRDALSGSFQSIRIASFHDECEADTYADLLEYRATMDATTPAGGQG